LAKMADRAEFSECVYKYCTCKVSRKSLQIWRYSIFIANGKKGC